MTRRSHPRDGILLLIVLSLLVLFALIGVTFVVVASHYSRSAKAFSKHERRGDDPVKELDGAMYLLLRGSKDPANLTYRHNLLSDLYGRDGFVGTVGNATPVVVPANTEFIRLDFIAPIRSLDPNVPDNIPFALDPSAPPTTPRLPLPRACAGYYNGGVLTMLDGDARGQSMRIADYAPVQTTTGQLPGTIFVVATEELAGRILPGDRFIVNGKPFNGTGDGLGAEGELDETDPMWDHEVSLLPNLRQNVVDFHVRAGLPGTRSKPTYPLIALGDSDESWDAPDFQNFFLARVPVITPTNPLSPNNPLIPSFHRPFLVNYWMHEADPAQPWDGQGLIPADPLTELPFAARRRMVIARPLPQDHPLFTGSNPAFAGLASYLADPDMDGSLQYNAGFDGFAESPVTQGPWDVDNDNDGIPDSIWVDLGMPVKTSADGRLYKPLFAVLCVDLDGRLNVNAHGVNLRGLPSEPSPGNITRGQGYGPAEIRLPPGVAEALLTARQRGNYDRPLNPSPGFTGENVKQSLDSLSFLSQWEYPNRFEEQFRSEPGSAFQTPSDLRGIGGIYLDVTGQPRYASMGMAELAETEDDPYETNLVTPNAADNLFTVNDLEQLLRFADLDSSAHAGRLRRILVNPLEFGKLTTHSFDIPTPGFLPPMLEMRGPLSQTRQLRDEADRPLLGIQSTVSDLVRARLIANGYRNDLSNEPPTINLPSERALAAEMQVQLMVPPEIRQGRRMDINRWLNNARDDSGDGTVDEPGDTVVLEKIWTESPFETQVKFIVDDPPRDPASYQRRYDEVSDPAKVIYSRQVYARHLYCLMMLLIDSRNGNVGANFEFATAHGLSVDERREVTARRIAQWAINVVDFRDPDVTMTPFEFDLRPFDDDGWDVDDDYTTVDGGDRAIVWGCEQPELLITETVAFHDRGVKDTDRDPSGQMRNKLPMPPEDEDMDQVRIPVGSLFLELYCVRNRPGNVKSVAPLSLYSTSNPNADQIKQGAVSNYRLDLGRMVNGSPVWRVAIADPIPRGGNPRDYSAVMWPTLFDSMNPYNDPFDPNDEGILANGLPQLGLAIDRYIVFTDRHPGNAPPGTYYYRRPGSSLGLLEPGQYAVVGPRPFTHLGRTNADEDSTQQIELGPNFIRHRQVSGSYRPIPASVESPPGRVRNVVGMIAAADAVGWTTGPIGMNVSEPVPSVWDRATGLVAASYYAEPDDPGKPGFYLTPFDEPMDDRSTRPLGVPGKRTTGTHLRFRVALLQRLADPTKPWQVTTNPYITVDSQSIDLTVFNGADDETSTEPNGWDRDNYGPYDPADISNPDVGAGEPPNPEEHFQSRQRGVGLTTNIWNPASRVPVRTIPDATDATHYWKHNLHHTLGYLNETYGLPQDRPVGYEGRPLRPFPWLVWNNRPFVSQLELMQVPSASPWRLMHEFRLTTVGGPSPYDTQSNPDFSHLLNFFNGSHTAGQDANFCRLLDYLAVPSRFVGTEKWLNPQVSSLLSGELASYATPFNKVSMFRDPGRVNVNTIPDEDVWLAIDPAPTTSTRWETLSRSLHGDTSLGRPAYYANPMRSVASADLMPSGLRRDPADAGLLRSATGKEMLFDFSAARNVDLVNDSNNPEQNSYFKYHKLQRLGNLLTTHSNVYAIWITVGYFEVHPWAPPGDPANPMWQLTALSAHPDGLQLGRELGSDTGEINRHRAFYLIDRSIPVAYEPGENHNVDKAILLRRLIE